ncbi:MAG: tripartite tricarboxylate transporter substrate binding protein [Burkholderiales bacterium]|nr:tripartite tricarboxylate transporter substrate binding protein [Burkholderiales bacterium]
MKIRVRERLDPRPLRCAVACLIFAAARAPSALAQIYPVKPIRVIVPVTAGGSTDHTARVVMHKMSALLGQPIIVDNRPGAHSIIGTDIVAKAHPDGYTLLVAFAAHISTTVMASNLPFDTVKDFQGVSLLATQPLIVLVSNQIAPRSIKDLIAFAKASPGKLNYGLPGTGGAAHIAAEMFRLITATNIVAVPYKGAAPAQLALSRNEVQFMFANIQTGIAMAKGGRATVIAIATDKRSTYFPEVPTFAEQGIAKFDVEPWQGLLAPSRVPRAVISALHRAAVGAIQSPEVAEKLLAVGSTPVGSDPDAFDARISAQLKSWGEVVARAGLKLD